MTPFLTMPLEYMPVFCALFLLALLMNMYVWISAAVCRGPVGMLRLNCALFCASFFSMFVLTEGCCALYDGQKPPLVSGLCLKLPAVLFAFLGFFLIVASVCSCIRLNKWRNGHISRMSIKESVDALPTGLVFGYEDGVPRLINLRMHALGHRLTGESIYDMGVFWDTVSTGALAPGNERVRDGALPIIKMADGTFWSFERKRLAQGDAVIIQITAANTTEELLLAKQLEEENMRLREMSKRLRDYGETVREVTREKERLDAKARIHDELGHALIATRRMLTVQCSPAEMQNTVSLWRHSVSMLNQEAVCERTESGYAQLTEAAKAIGVHVLWSGEKPREGTEAAHVLLRATHECLTNTVRHASGTKLFAAIQRDDKHWRFTFANNGAKPTSAIHEGGGLSSLRRCVEEAGGKMDISHAPHFELTITIPEKDEVPT